MASADRSISDANFWAKYPKLGLSGSIISATICIPHSLKYRAGADWALSPRKGASALFASFTHLASDNTPWKHILVGWTGEIEPTPDHLLPPETPSGSIVTLHSTSMGRGSTYILGEGKIAQSTPRQSDDLWISRKDQERLEQQLAHDNHGRVVPVWLGYDDEETEAGIVLTNQERWRWFADNRLYTLFHLQHKQPDDDRTERTAWANYYRMNQKFADRIIEIYKPGDIVVIHDYYLLLVPAMLRQRMRNMYTMLYLHIPFPNGEFLRCLPRRKDILEGMLGADLVGFQAYTYARQFCSSCTRILGFESDRTGVHAYGDKINVDVFPIGIDAAAIEKLAFGQTIDDKVNTLRSLYRGKKIIVCQDRMDILSGMPQKLMAFERFLENYPQWRRKVVLIRLTSSSSPQATPIEHEPDGDSGSNIAGQVSDLVANINALYGSPSFSPVQHYSQEEYLALLRCADVGLIESVRDGMDTTSMEYVICQRDQHGLMIMSEFSGTAERFRGAIHVNPFDLTGVATRLRDALDMPAQDRLLVHQHLYPLITTQNVQDWQGRLLHRLLRLLSSRNSLYSTPLLDRMDMLTEFRRAKKRLFILGYDGVLVPNVKELVAASPSETVIQTLRDLSKDCRNVVWIVSGRDQKFVSKNLGGLKDLGLTAERGTFMRYPGSMEWEDLAENLDLSWQTEVTKIMQRYTDGLPGSYVEFKHCALTWHYSETSPKALANSQAHNLLYELHYSVGKKWDLEIVEDEAEVEVLPTAMSKGIAVSRLLASYAGPRSPPGEKTAAISGKFSLGEEDNPLDFVLCFGGDYADEDMFRVLNSEPRKQNFTHEQLWTVAVGAASKASLAWYSLEPGDVISVLQSLCNR